MSEYDRNQEVALRICRDLRWNGWHFKAGDYVSLLDADVVAVADSPEKALAALRSIDPRPSRGMVLEVSSPVQDVIR
jgi:hypothetical protein